jgi:hypothetical protein
MTRWAVADMDDGILRWEPTRRAAVDWLLGFHCTDRVLRRHICGGGSYEYAVGAGWDDHGSGFVARADRLAAHGWDPEQPALYPIEDDPYRMVDRSPLVCATHGNQHPCRICT